MDNNELRGRHNDAIHDYRAGRHEAASQQLNALLDVGFAPAGRALFEMLKAQGGSAHVLEVAARTANLDPMNFDFIQRAVAEVVVVANRIGKPYEPIQSKPTAWSFIVCSHNQQKYERFRSALERVRGKHELQLIRIDNARSMGEGYERGFRLATHDNIVLCHHDVELLLPDGLDWLAAALKQFDGVGVSGATRMTGPAMHFDGHPHLVGRLVQPDTADGIQLFTTSPFRGARKASVFDGAFMSFRRHVLEHIGFDTNLEGFHYYDVDLCYRAVQADYNLGIVPQIALLHDSHGEYDDSWLVAKRYFESKHRMPDDGRARPRHFYANPIGRDLVGRVWQILNELSDKTDQEALALTHDAP